jgi:chromate reductase, NAD(P)H dehydrogenase (quinone)
MITIFSATNRPDSYTEAIARLYAELLHARGQQAQVFSLRDLPEGLDDPMIYEQRGQALSGLINSLIENVDKFVFVVPEYNGSFPGILKLFIDAVPPRVWRDKKAAIVGVSSGKAGNLRGQEHLTGILHYLRMHVHYLKPKLSGIEGLMDDQRKLIDEPSMRVLNDHAAAIAAW